MIPLPMRVSSGLLATTTALGIQGVGKLEPGAVVGDPTGDSVTDLTGDVVGDPEPGAVVGGLVGAPVGDPVGDLEAPVSGSQIETQSISNRYAT
jgi:hypothetical protein